MVIMVGETRLMGGTAVPRRCATASMRLLSILPLLMLLTGCWRERTMRASDPHAVVAAIKGQCDADEAARFAGNPESHYLWRLDSCDEAGCEIHIFVSRFDDIFTRIHFGVRALPAADGGRGAVLVQYEYEPPHRALPVFPLIADMPDADGILARVQELVDVRKATAPLATH